MSNSSTVRFELSSLVTDSSYYFYWGLNSAVVTTSPITLAKPQQLIGLSTIPATIELQVFDYPILSKIAFRRVAY